MENDESLNDVLRADNPKRTEKEEKRFFERTLQECHLKFGIFNQYHELVMAIENSEKAFKIAKEYDYEVKELF